MDIELLVRGVVKKIVQEYQGFNLDVDDLISEGCLIACERMKDYKSNTGASVSTYLTSQVRFRLRNYVSRVMMKGLYGAEGFRRVSMEHVDQEVSIDTERETRMALDEVSLSLDTEDRKILTALRCGYTYREAAAELGVSTGYISGRLKVWNAMFGETL